MINYLFISSREWQKELTQIRIDEGTRICRPVKETFGLSYDQLPIYLKPCFLYLGLFPEGSTIPGGILIRLWIAEGFVESDNMETLEVAGSRYLQELIDHTMVQVVGKTYSGKAKTIRIHDIMRDFCISKAKDLDFLIVSEAIGNTSRRAAINLSKSFILPAAKSRLRSLAVLGKASTNGASENTSQGNRICPDLNQVCKIFKLLRVLDIFGIKSPTEHCQQKSANYFT